MTAPSSPPTPAPARRLAVRLAQALWLAPRRLLALPVKAYRLLLSPWLGQSCRFEPTCSRYMLQALERHGAVAGLGLGTWRILRCHPYCHGGCDPVPDNLDLPRSVSRLFTRLLPPAAGAAGASGSTSDLPPCSSPSSPSPSPSSAKTPS